MFRSQFVTRFGLSCLLSTSAAALALAAAAPAWAQSAPAQHSFDIPALPLNEALRLFMQQSGIQISYASGDGANVRTSAVKGDLAPAAALSQLLTGTGLTYRFTAPTSAILEPAPTADAGTVQLGPVRVAADDQADGTIPTPKTDLAATDRSRSYGARAATVADKSATTLREIPQSVTVVTRQRMDDQNIVSLFDVAQTAPGVTPFTRVGLSDNNVAYYIRGYLSQLEYDGVPINSTTSSQNQFDMAMYDRVEILRGPSGLIDGAGEPSGTINMVRKRPHDSFGWAGSLMGGSWNKFHGDLDVTGPLNNTGTIRGRLVAAGQDRDNFVDSEHERHGMLYGIVEFDIDPRTTFTVSGAVEGSKQDGIDYGVMPRADGSYVQAPRSTFYGVPWSYTKGPTREAYASLSHDFGGNWKLNTSLNYRWSDYDTVYGYQFGTVNPDNSIKNYWLEHDFIQRKNLVFDVNVNGPISLFGREHRVMLGASDSWSDTVSKGGLKFTSLSDIFNVNIPEQDIPLTSATDTRTEQYGIYGKIRFNISDPLKLIVGGRVTNYRSKTRSGLNAWGAWDKDPDINGHVTPYAGLLYDVTKNVTLYGSFTTIFAPQTDLKYGGGTLKPRTGQQFEAGAKGAFFGDALNVSAALFTMTDRNRAFQDEEHPDFYIAAGKVRSRGAEVEVSGQPLQGWNLSAGYTYLETKFLEDDTSQGEAYDAQEPKHLFKLWTSYRFGDPDRPGFQIGGGLRAQSATRRRDHAQPGYVVADLQAGYRLNPQWSATVTINNLFDKSYYVVIPDQIGGLYGNPRSVTVAIRKSF